MVKEIYRCLQDRTQIKTLVALAIGVCFLMLSAYLTISSQYRQNNAVQWSSHSFLVLLKSEKIFADTSVMDREARDFIYRRSFRAKDTFYELKNTIPQEIQSLRVLVSDSHDQTAELDAFDKLSKRQIEILNSAIIQYDNVDGHIAEKMATLKDAGPMTRLTLTKLTNLATREKAYLDSRQTIVRNAQDLATFAMFTYLVAGCCIIAFSFRSAMAANMTLAQKARLEERESRAAELLASEQRSNEQARLLTALNKASANLVSEHDVSTIVQDVVDYGIAITGAQYGAFFFLMEENGEKLLHLEALSGLPRESFPATNYLRATDLFVSHTADILIAEDIHDHPKFGTNPHKGFPKNHPAVASYIGIPIISTAGVQIGALLFGHNEPGRFNQTHMETVKGLAGITSIVIENAHLYSAIQVELDEKTRTQNELIDAATRQKLLLQELNHRVKNTLVTVQSIAIQTKNAAISKLGLTAYPDRLLNLNRFFAAFDSRLLSLSGTHDLLVNGAWGDVLLSDALSAAIAPLIDPERVVTEGPAIKLSPNAAVTINMVFHELLTNAIKYGAGSTLNGTIAVTWTIKDNIVRLLWKEQGGPTVRNPDGIGFGSKLLERAIGREMKGKSQIIFLPDGVECYIEIPLSKSIRLSE